MKYQLALVTGASSGIGKELCHILANEDINLIITGRNEEELNKLAEQLSSKVHVDIIVADLADQRQRNTLIATIQEKVPDLVINNAGFGLVGAILTHDANAHKEVIEVNATALMEIAIEAARTLQNRGKKGTIVNIASTAAFQPMPYLAVYAATKAFVKQFSEAFDYEMKPYGIRVLTSCPGTVHTNFGIRANRGIAPSYDGKKTGMTSQYAAEEIWHQIQKEKSIYLFDSRFRLLAFLTSHLLPRSWVNRTIAGYLKDIYLLPSVDKK